MMDAVLLVDDEPSMLAAYRVFLGPTYAITTVDGGEAALAALAGRGPFAVVVSDLHMPGMDGIRFLAAARAGYPDTVRILMTGQPDLAHAVQAVNDGHIFQFLTKPCAPEAFRTAVAAAVGEYRAVAAERERSQLALWASEERYRQLFDAHPHPLWVYDADTRQFLEVNDAAVRQYGYSRAAFLGLTVGQVDPADAPPPAGFGPAVRVCRHRLASGEERQVEVTTRPIEFGARAACLAMAVDLTERKQLEEQLKQAQKLESIGQLAAGVAHEINTPVQYIGDNTNFLAGAFRDLGAVLALYRAAGDDPARWREADREAAEADLDYLLDEAPRAIAQTLDGVRHVARIVQAMKEFAHPGMEEKVPVDLNHAVETVITVARNEWKYVADLETDLDPVLPAVPGLPGELNQVLLNLLVNAAHAVQAAGRSSADKGRITITTRPAAGGVEVSVADTGCGIPEAIRHRVFDPFFTTKPVGRGTGQGLAIAHAVVVQRHGGTISLESELGRGTTFVVRLPGYGDRMTQSQRVRAAAIQRVLPAVPPGEGPA
ncbi:MAG: putative Signal transduction histidine kinase [Gemmataceae bacterium]|nr:putative Signal transduction histidine kinase [Gemmataceae bacterium]